MYYSVLVVIITIILTSGWKNFNFCERFHDAFLETYDGEKTGM